MKLRLFENEARRISRTEHLDGYIAFEVSVVRQPDMPEATAAQGGEQLVASGKDFHVAKAKLA